ncbi:phosphotransferase enzyme family protein [Primorskyibacter sp. S187A]|uniref:phosphotransferase enzyme family protein n=1 Tax=Primorskyibacter sp. S187A TaxID=3415130 RepID=UPI003C7A86C4
MKIVRKALALWGMAEASARLVAARENAVYRIAHASGLFALRLHRQGYRTDAQLTAELDWMAMLTRAGLSVPAPIRSLAGPHLQSVEGIQVDVLTWMDGETLDRALPKQDACIRRAVFERLGQTMARMHEACDTWPDAATCDRPAWDSTGLLGEAPLWDRFWDNPALSAPQKTLMQTFRARALETLSRLGPSLDYGLIHADLVPANVMWTGADLHLIDFDDGGFGFRLFDIATALFKHRNAPDYDDLHSALLRGYASVRPIDLDLLPLFLALRAVTYVGWNITREPDAEHSGRNARFIAQAEEVVSAYLDA